ncbi:hypothetical protein [Gracilibacillus kekensis]|uniref:Cro/C1-type HTH DNA-binding domain-containing protein n=1 Tax=Gracilibacillus kekensis TaxID=1027249 RepID=A0A1M7QQU7_9BACI|nr:hypothetical protein [Gracilibacillus kekensis]SHN33669.1 hypothetical protein SAMN05216179_3454 [Gracilibacillus kekensis]
MNSYNDYRKKHLRLLRKSINEVVQQKGFTSLHDLHLQQNWMYHTSQDSSWSPISKKALYSLVHSEGNPRLDTLLKFCYLLQIDCTTLLKEEDND